MTRRDSQRTATYVAELRAEALNYDPHLTEDVARYLVASALSHLDDLGYVGDPEVLVLHPDVTVEFKRYSHTRSGVAWSRRNRITFYGTPSRGTALHEVAHLRVPDAHPAHGVMFRHVSALLHDEFVPELPGAHLRDAYDGANLPHAFDERHARKVRARGVWLFNRGAPGSPGYADLRAERMSFTHSFAPVLASAGAGAGAVFLRVITTPLRDVDTGVIRSITFAGLAVVDSKAGITFTQAGVGADGMSAPVSLPWNRVAYVDGRY